MNKTTKLVIATSITCLLFFSILLFGTMLTWFFSDITINKVMIAYGIVLFYFTIWCLYFMLGLFDK